MRRKLEYFQGCLIGGAIGDALGAPVEFSRNSEIVQEFGPGGVQDFIFFDSKRKAWITDDTQMTIFTAEGILRANTRLKRQGVSDPTTIVFHSYLRWLHTQSLNPSKPVPEVSYDGWLMNVKGLYANGAPGITCLSSLMSGVMGTLEQPINNSKGCGGVMRVAPVGLFYPKEEVFDRAVAFAAITHGHPLGYYSAGLFALIICNIISGMTILEAVIDSLKSYKQKCDDLQLINLIEKAIEFSNSSTAPETSIRNLGQGAVGEEAIAIAVYSALKAGNDFKNGVTIAVNHDGDSDSTGSITGNILGAYLGFSAIPADWVRNIELANEILELANDLMVGYQDDEQWFNKYPG